MYAARIDQLTYFLFGILAMNPYDCLSSIMERAGLSQSPEEQDVAQQVNQLQVDWDYSVFWILEEQVRKITFKSLSL